MSGQSKRERMYRSDMWRGMRYTERAREVAYVTRGIGDYFGAACDSRQYRIKWEDQTEAAGATDIRRQVVIFRGALLNGKTAPFDAGFVDQLTGIAAHEAGHVTIHDQYGDYAAGNDPLAHFARNVIEDLAIDGQPMRKANGGLGELTTMLRTDSDWSEENRKRIAEHWQSDQPFDAMTLLRIWGCSLLFRCENLLTPLAHRQRERGYIDRLNTYGLRVRDSSTSLDAGYLMSQLLNDSTDMVIAIIREMQASDPKPQPESGQSGQSGDESGSGASGSGQSEDEEESESENGGSAGTDEEESEESESGSAGDSGEAGEDESGSESGKSGGSGDSGSESKSESESAASGGKSEESNGGSGGSGAAGASKSDQPLPLPELEPTEAANGQPRDPALDAAFWREVSTEIERLEIQSFMNHGRGNVSQMLAPFTDRKIVSAIRAAYDQLASEPARQHRQDSGRIDRRQLPFIHERQDCFTRDRERTLKGTLALVLDLSGSTANQQDLIKRIAASVYLSLRGTEIKCYIYGYGQPNVYQIASPTRVVPFDEFFSGGGTPTASAISAVVREVKPSGQSMMIHVTDGDPHSIDAAQRAMIKAREAGWLLVNIGVGQPNIASIYPMSDHAEAINRYDQLPAIIREAVRQIVKSGKARIK